jgi:hypothetical protein
MTEPSSANAPDASAVHSHLQAVAQLLRRADHLGPEAREALAELVDELAGALTAAPVPSAELKHLTESTTHLIQAIGERHHTGVLAAARDRLNEAIVRAETGAPTVAGIARRLVEALSNIGI